MTLWRPQTFKNAARADGRSSIVIQHAIETARVLREKTPSARPIFSLKHLSHLTGVQYDLLRRVASRHQPEPYRVFRILKRPLPGEETRFRTIVVPSPWLMSLQRWMNADILQSAVPHEASVAFSQGDTIREAAATHCGCQWLIKVDIRNFFESITEAQVFRVFESIGYQPLIAFEMARLCTRVGDRETRRFHRRFRSDANDESTILAYRAGIMGHLPQGAPTSPRIANLVARELDAALTGVAESHDLIYTRYADDLTFSTRQRNLDRSTVRDVVGQVYAAIATNGFAPNTAKTSVSAPGARKIVLGLLVDRDTPRLTREFKATLRQHLYYLRREGIGPSGHAARRGGATIPGLRRHVLGLIHHARQIEFEYGDARLTEFNEIVW
ncbi:MAG: reverse transcriptase family protein [Methylocystis sp.]|jgi:RNA-directed DNA polymerase